MRRLFLVWAAVAASLAVVAPVASADLTAEYFPMPAGYTGSGGIDTTPAGIVYFGTGNTSQDHEISQRPAIGRLDPALALAGTSNGMTFAKTPAYLSCCATQIRDLAYSVKTGTLFWTRSDGLVGRADGDLMQSVETAGHVAPWGIAAAPDGGAWLTEYGTGNSPDYFGARPAYLSAGVALSEALPNIASQTGQFQSIRYDSKPKGIAVAPDGTTWFAESDAGNPGYRIAKVGGANYVEYAVPCAATCTGPTGVTDVAVAKDGSVWYTNELQHTVGHLIPGVTITEYPLAGLAGGIPKAIRAAGDGTLWVAVYGGYGAPNANAIVKLVPSDGAVAPTATAYKLGKDFFPLQVEPDALGNVWFSGSPYSGAGQIGRLSGATQPNPGDPGPGTGTPPGGGVMTIAGTTTTLTSSVSALARISDPRVHGDSMTANQICVGPPQDRCSLVYLIQSHEYVTGFPGSHADAAAAKPKSRLVTIGKATISLAGGQSKKITIKLNAKGRKLLKKTKKLKSTLTVTQSRNGAKPKTILKKSLTFRR